jgi:hypothetical protein
VGAVLLRGYPWGVALEFQLDPHFAAVVERARRRAVGLGEVPAGQGSFEPTVPEEARSVIAEWLRDGGYEEALAEVAAEDPDLANQ